MEPGEMVGTISELWRFPVEVSKASGWMKP